MTNLEFTMGYDGECEDFNFTKDDIDLTDNISFDDVTNYIKKLEDTIDKFFLSEHRTEGNIYFNDNGTMDIFFCYFTEPDDDKFKNYKIKKIPTIEFEFTHEEE
jgi:hypothetical protein